MDNEADELLIGNVDADEASELIGSLTNDSLLSNWIRFKHHSLCVGVCVCVCVSVSLNVFGRVQEDTK